MMNLLEEAVIYATVMHTGRTRKKTNVPYILHPLEVAQIISSITDDIEVITAGVLHDVVEDAGGSIEEIRSRFGDRVAMLVEADTVMRSEDESLEESWERRKKAGLALLENSDDIGVKTVWLGDQLSNIRSLARMFSENGNAMWDAFHQKESARQKWFFQTVGELLEIDLNKTGAFKEYIRLVNSIWPGTFDNDKTKYRKYKEISVEGCEIIGRGAKATVYRYDSELVVKVYNEHNLFKEIERENYLARKAFVAGIPTAISFGIVTVGNKYGSLFELLNSNSVSNLIARNPDHVDFYASAMADLAHTMHTADGSEIDLADYTPKLYEWLEIGVANADPVAAERIRVIFDKLPRMTTIIHGDFHTGNVMEQNGELLLIDMDRLSVCHPIVDLGAIYQFYWAMGELNPAVIEDFMGFSYDTAKQFCRAFMQRYAEISDYRDAEDLTNKAALLAYVRMVRRCYKKGADLSDENQRACDYYMAKINELLGKVSTLNA